MEKDMTSGNPLKLILWFSLPVLLGNIFQQFYNMVDAIIVGRLLGEEALAAVGATGCIMFLVLFFAIGIAQGFGVLVSQAFGAKDYSLLKHYVALSLMLTVIISVVVTAITVPSAKWMLVFMKTPSNILDMAASYVKIIFWGIGATMFYNAASSILRGIGDSKTPLYFLVFSSLLNIVLDYCFIRFLGLGTDGAAYATVLAQGISALFCLLYMFWKFEILRTKRSDYYFDSVGVWELMRIGLPMALNYSITAIGTMILQSAVNIFGSSVVASLTAAMKVEQLSTQTMPTLGTTMSTYCGQNLGAGEYRRIYDGMKKAFFISVILTGLAALICVLGGKTIVGLFLADPTDKILSYSTIYLNTISIFFFFLSILFLYRMALQGLGNGLVPMIGGFLELVGRLFVVMFFVDSFGYRAVCMASPAAWILAGIPNMAAYLLWKRKQQKKEQAS
ncbi:MAG: MATE family efflux transporter [Lachnospiraceae bacterium]|nr:MATE family efflux transporter [Lachnospiraceae bacterium]